VVKINTRFSVVVGYLYRPSRKPVAYNQVITNWKKKRFKLSLCTPWRCIRNGRLAPLILNLSTRWGEWSSSLPGHFTVRQELPVAIEWEPGWSTDLVWNFWRCAKFLIPARIQTPSLFSP